ncbi:MAG: ATP-binding protein [Paludibacteraceae bacterium]
MATIIGRRDEQRQLMDLYKSGKPEFLAVYGRRRVGKTFLIRETLRDKITFTHTGLSIYEDEKPVTTEDQLAHFYHSLQVHGSDADHCPKDWMEAIYMLEALLEKLDDGERQVVFIDELPWLDTDGARIIMAIDAFWNGWAAGRENIMLIVCGSAASWMLKNVVKEKGGLFNRLTDDMKISPFNLHETEEFLQSKGVELSRYDLVQAYMAVGGIPYYLNFFRKGMSLAQNIDALFFDSKAKLRLEFSKLFISLFRYPENYVRVIRFLFTKHCGYTREEIAKHLHMETGGTFSAILEALVESDFICCYRPYDAAPYEKLYRLVDPFCLMWLYWKEKEGVTDTKFWQRNVNSSVLHRWGGVAFEEVCMMHLPQMKQALHIAAVQTEQSPYTLRGTTDHDGTQCDLIISRADRVVNLCEMKYSQEEFAIDKAYDKVLRNRMARVREKLKQTQTLQLTFVTTFGVKPNMYSGIVQSEIVLDDLFL